MVTSCNVLISHLLIVIHIPAKKKKKKSSAKNTIENVMDLRVIMRIVLVLMESIMVSTGM